MDTNMHVHTHTFKKKITEFPYVWLLEKTFQSTVFFYAMLESDPHQNSWSKGSRLR